MAPRAFLLCVCFTIGLLSCCSLGVNSLDIGLGFLVEPSDVIVVRSKSTTLECAARSPLGAVNITWTHNGKAIPIASGAQSNESRRVMTEAGSLHIKKVVTKRMGPDDGPDQGEYRCFASANVANAANAANGASTSNSVAANAVTLVSRPAQLRVAVLSQDFTESPSDVTVEEGSTIRFACQIESVPNVLTAWEKDNKPIPTNSRYIFIASGVLFISAAEKGDAGTYRCVVTNPLTRKQRTSNGGQLTVISRTTTSSPPTFLTTVTSLQVNIGGNLTLECGATGWPPPKLTWLHASQVPNKTVNLPGVSILHVNHVSVNHTGNYSCSTGTGNDAPTQTINVMVLAPPTFAKGPLSQVYPTAKTVRFDCDVRGVPMPVVTWLKDGSVLKINGRIKQRPSELLLSNTVTDDSGLYQCVAKNSAGEAWVAGRLLVNSSRYQPDPPHGLTCQTKSASQIEVTWQHGDPKQADSLIKAYTVHYLPLAGGEERQDVSVNKSIIIEKLAAFTNYTFYVRAYSGRSASDQSHRVVCQTGEGVPQWVPTLTLEPTSPTTLRVVWVPLANEKARGLVIEYKIQWRRKGSPSYNVEQLKGDVLEYTITELYPGKKYEVRVLAATSKGWPDLPDEQLHWINVDMPSHGTQTAPLVHLTVVNFTSIDVSWALPTDATYKPSGYKLFYRKQNGQAGEPISLGANVTQYLLSGLDPDELYEVHVVGWTGKGEGGRGFKSIHTLAYTSTVTVTPSLSHLEPPTSLYAEPTSATAINLTWSPPTRSGNISYYTVCFAPVASSAPSNYLSSTSNGVEITNLSPYALYEFKVRSHDLQSHGPFSQTVECRTQEDVPGMVRDLQWKVLNGTSGRVSWKAPDKSNGVISAYLVAFSSDTAIPEEQWPSQRVPTPKMNTDLSEIVPNVRYILSVRAETRAGLGPPPRVPFFFIIPKRITTSPPVTNEETISDEQLGILVGVAIGMGCLVLCVSAVVWRRRCTQSAFPERNGNGCCRDRHAAAAAAAAGNDLHELELLSDTSTQLPPATHIARGNHVHLEKGGGCYPNGQANGLSNGHAVRVRTNVHITENPQYNQKCLVSSTPVASSRSNLQDEHSSPLLPVEVLGNSDDGTGDTFQAMDAQTDNSNPADWTQLTSLDETSVTRTGNNISNIHPTLMTTTLPQQT